MNLKGFFVTSLSQALDLAIATPDDVLRHVTPDLLAEHLPRPLWARLITACMGAPRVDAQLVVETIGVPNLCEHIPTGVIWACITEIAQRALGQEPFVLLTPAAVKPAVVPLTPPPPPAAEPKAAAAPGSVSKGPNIPAPGSSSVSDVVASLDADERASGRSRSPTSQRFRSSNTGIGRLAATNNARRPQASATQAPASPAVTSPPPAPDAGRPRRGQTESDGYDFETEVGKDDWKNALAVEDEQLVDWSASEETVTASGETREDLARKR